MLILSISSFFKNLKIFFFFHLESLIVRFITIFRLSKIKFIDPMPILLISSFFKNLKKFFFSFTRRIKYRMFHYDFLIFEGKIYRSNANFIDFVFFQKFENLFFPIYEKSCIIRFITIFRLSKIKFIDPMPILSISSFFKNLKKNFFFYLHKKNHVSYVSSRFFDFRR